MRVNNVNAYKNKRSYSLQHKQFFFGASVIVLISVFFLHYGFGFITQLLLIVVHCCKSIVIHSALDVPINYPLSQLLSWTLIFRFPFMTNFMINIER